MSVKIKLRREGGNKKPFYKVVVIDSRKACNAKFIEQLGYYQPLSSIFEVKVDPNDIGKVIGRQGRNIKSIRTIVNAAAQKDDKRVVLEIVE